MTQGNGTETFQAARARLAERSGAEAVRGGLEAAMERAQRNADVLRALPSRSARVEAGLAAIEEAEREREQLRSALQATEADLRGVRAELAALQLASSQLQTQVERCQRERDVAVAGHVRADTLIDAMLTLMHKHRGAPFQPGLEGDAYDAYVEELADLPKAGT
jgi:chromosome segregation ATPase